MELLNKLNLPQDLKRLTQSELYQLAREIRAQIIDVTSKNGGHLASNLGIVELTVALHTALQSPVDKIIWDVGHQSYTHKILTGRLKDFPTIRQYGGLSGFTKREESPHDIFGAGHAATSLSAAIGIAKARDLKGEKFAVLTVIGDSSISSGEAFEAINNIKTIKGPFIIVLNDNEMSISKPVGVLSDHITSLRYNQVYRKFKKKAEKLILKLPEIGKPLTVSIDKLLRRTKHLLINYFKIGVIYEEFGIRYLGPIEADNIPHIIGAIRYAQKAPEPVMIHVLSKKGQGFRPAEEDPTTYHGLGKFNPQTGEIKVSQTKSYTEVFGQTLVKEAQVNPKIVAITAAMTDGTGLCEFQKQFPDRLVDVGISEEHAVTFAGGLAVEGFVPVVAIYSTFMQRAYDQIIHDIALQKLPVIFALDRAGLVGEDGPTHHGVFDLVFLRSIPNMLIMAPKDVREMEQMLALAFQHKAGPIALRYPRGAVPQNSMPESPLLLGEAELLISGKNAKTTVIAIGSMVSLAYDVILESKLNVNLVNCRFLKPLDKAGLKKMIGTSQKVVTLEEGIKQGGLYSAVAELLLEEKISATLTGLGIEDTQFVTHGARDRLLIDCGLTKENLLASL